MSAYSASGQSQMPALMMAHDDDASSNRSWSLVGSKHGATVIPGDSSNVEVKYHQQQWDRSEYPGGLTPVGHPKDFTPGFMVCYTTRGGSENDCHCPNLIVEITGLPLSDPDMTFLVDTHKIERVEDIKFIVQWWVSEGCVDHGLEATEWIPKSHWALHSIERATPHNMPTKYLKKTDMPLKFSWHTWSPSYKKSHSSVVV